MTRQNAVDLITSKFSKFAEVYQTYQDITKALNERNSELLESTILDYQKPIQKWILLFKPFVKTENMS